jgi:hypothetical protein
MSVLPIPWGGCPWPTDPACFTAEFDELPADVKERALALASATLNRLTAYRVGGCPITVRPCKASCAEEYGRFYGSAFAPHINMQGSWVNACGCRTDCSCGPLCELALPLPIGEVTSVLVGADEIVADVKILGDRLVYTGSDDCPFPSCQDLSAAPGEENTFTVTYLNSYPVDALGAYAAAILTMEFAKACTGDKKCRLPTGTTSVVRQGVTIEVASGTFPDGRTQIREVDAFLDLWAPEGAPKQPPKIWSPARHRPRVER